MAPVRKDLVTPTQPLYGRSTDAIAANLG
jgi:hypothetical protein